MKIVLLAFIIVVMFISLASDCSRSDTFNLSIGITGDGTVTPAEGSHRIERGATVDLTVTPAEGWEFDRWTGPNANDVIEDGESYKINMNSNKSITAEFVLSGEFVGEPYSISGYVYTQEDEGFAEVSIFFGNDYSSVTTNQEGYWEKHNLAGVVEVTASYANNTFSPGVIVVEGARNDVNFVGIELEDWQRDIVLEERAKIFTKGEAGNIEHVSPARDELSFKEKTTFVKQLQVGDIIVVNQAVPNAEHGLLKEITGIDDDNKTFQVKPANLEDVIYEGNIEIEKTFSFEEMVAKIEQAEGVRVLKVDKEAKTLFFESDFDRSIFDGKGSVSGHIKFNHDLEANIDISWWRGRINELILVFSMDLDTAVDIEVNVDHEVEWPESEIVLLNTPLVPPPGIPIFLCVNINPYLRLVAGAEAEVSAEFSAGAAYSRGFEIGIRKEADDRWRDSGVLGLTGTGIEVNEPTLNGKASAKVYTGVELDLMVGVSYVLEGGLSAGAYGNLMAEAEVQILPQWLWHYDLDFIIDARLAVKLQILRFKEQPEFELPRKPLLNIPLAYGISGMTTDKTGAGISDVDINFSGFPRNFSSVKTDNDGRWSKHLLSGTGNVSAAKPGYNFEPVSIEVLKSTSNVNFTSDKPPYSISGKINGLHSGPFNYIAVPHYRDVEIRFSGGHSSVKPDENGNWSKSNLRGDVTVTPTMGALLFTFEPASRTVTGAANNVDFNVISKFPEGFPELIGVPSGSIRFYIPDFTIWPDIYLGHNIEMGQYPVTFDEYTEFCNATGKDIPYDNGYGKGSRPVINVSQNDAVEYCNWLSEVAGLEPAYYFDDEMWFLKGEPDELEGFRIPESYEWEYAARGGKDYIATRFSGSNNLDEVAWYYDNANWTTKPVGLKKANELGLYDMSGNVWEWLNCGRKKGGSYNDGDYNLFELNYVSQYYHNRDEGYGNIGFRVVRTLETR